MTDSIQTSRTVSPGIATDWQDVTDWVFDLDNTLYPPSCDLFGQVERRIHEFIAHHLNLDRDSALRLQKSYFKTYGTSLRGLMTEHAIDPLTYLNYVHVIDLTVVAENAALDRALADLPGRKLIFTNGSTAHAERVLSRLGIRQHFHDIFDIAAADYHPKPFAATYDRMVARFGLAPQTAVMVEDLGRNLAPAAALGMTTILVRGDAGWRHDGDEGHHIHHVTDDLAGFLRDAANRT